MYYLGVQRAQDFRASGFPQFQLLGLGPDRAFLKSKNRALGFLVRALGSISGFILLNISFENDFSPNF